MSASPARIEVDGKQFRRDGERFRFRGVTYGTFRPRADGALFPERDQLRRDFAAMASAGFTVVRTYTPPPDDAVELAAEFGLYLLVGVFCSDWRYLIGDSRGDQRAVAERLYAETRVVARRLHGNDHVLALSVGNEVPADVLRWFGTRKIARVIDAQMRLVREEDPDRLVTYTNYPTAEYLPLERADFLTFNVFLEDRGRFRAYLNRLQTLAGDRPLVLGEMGLEAGRDADGERRQAETIEWQLETAIERGVAGACLFSWTDDWWVGGKPVRDWHFGLTRGDRSPRPALDVARRWNARTVRDIDFRWPSLSVVICAYNAAATLEECLRATCGLDYPDLEIIVVDDGSTDDTPHIARRFDRVRLVSAQHAGLSAARNAGSRAARGSLIAFLDSDAYPSPEWPYFLALGMDRRDVGGVGGPNLPPPDDPPVAQQVARAPGGPVHVLVSDDRAEHVPGCNMAFWKNVLDEVGGFDPIFETAGDDVDMCWKVLDRGWKIAFHPAALVWHHRRASVKAYLRQQWHYGKSEALVEARHPHRFTAMGTARWRGSIYDFFAPAFAAQRIYRGPYGSAAYQSVYRSGGHALDIAHQLGIPLAVGLLAIAPLAALWGPLAAAPIAALCGIVALGAIDVARAGVPRRLRVNTLAFRLGVAMLHLLQPLMRTAGRLRRRASAFRATSAAPLPAPIDDLGDSVYLAPLDRPRSEIAAALIGHIRLAGLRVIAGTGWEEYDARVIGSTLVSGDLVTSAHPPGCVQIRLSPRLRRWNVLALLAAIALLMPVAPALALALAVVSLGESARGVRRLRAVFRRTVAAEAVPGARRARSVGRDS